MMAASAPKAFFSRPDIWLNWRLQQHGDLGDDLRTPVRSLFIFRSFAVHLSVHLPFPLCAHLFTLHVEVGVRSRAVS
jgi:hypothetical protein